MKTILYTINYDNMVLTTEFFWCIYLSIYLYMPTQMEVNLGFEMERVNSSSSSFHFPLQLFSLTTNFCSSQNITTTWLAHESVPKFMCEFMSPPSHIYTMDAMCQHGHAIYSLIQCLGRFLGIISQNLSVYMSNWLQRCDLLVTIQPNLKVDEGYS